MHFEATISLFYKLLIAFIILYIVVIFDNVLLFHTTHTYTHTSQTQAILNSQIGLE